MATTTRTPHPAETREEAMARIRRDPRWQRIWQKLVEQAAAELDAKAEAESTEKRSA